VQRGFHARLEALREPVEDVPELVDPVPLLAGLRPDGIHVIYDAPPDASARAVEATLDDPSFGRRAAAMGAALAELPSPEAVLDSVTTSLL
jgi:hypothetical protein